MSVIKLASWLIPLLILSVLIYSVQAVSHANSGDDIAASKIHKITIERFKFVPSEITVRIGDTVEWVNKDIAPHTATATNRNWDSGLMGNLDAWSLKITSSEDMEYFCLYHPTMKAMIFVDE